MINKTLASMDDKLTINALIIEDNPGDFFLFEEYIEEKFYNARVTHSLNFKDASLVLSSAEVPFDVVLLDATLPDKSGLSLVSEVLALAKQTPVLILTGYENLDFSMNSLSLGVSEYLLKDEMNAFLLHKSILFCIERKKYISSIEESERRYSELFHLSPIPMWVYEMDSLQIVNVNSAAIKNYGYSKSEFLAMKFFELTDSYNDQLGIEFSKNNPFNATDVIGHKLKDGTLIKVQIEQNSLVINGVSCCIILCNDITRLLDTQDSLSTAYDNIIKIEEKEKERFASELHDGLQQNIVAAKLIFSFLKEKLDVSHIQDKVTMLDQTLQAALEECAQLISEVRPKGIIENDFYSELESLIEKIKATGHIEVKLEYSANLNALFCSFNQMHIYRIIQELFNNSLKYASANQIEIAITIEGTNVILIYTDNGKGIAQKILNAKSSFISLKRRVQVLEATFQIDSELSVGTKVEIQVPINQLKK